MSETFQTSPHQPKAAVTAPDAASTTPRWEAAQAGCKNACPGCTCRVQHDFLKGEIS